MPTTRRRHLVTETDELSRALDDAAKRWPTDSGSRAKLLLHLVYEGHRALIGERRDRAAAHRDAVRRTAGALTGVYGRNYLDELRQDWPS